MNKTSTSLLFLGVTAKLCVRWKWKRKPTTWCTSLSWKKNWSVCPKTFIHSHIHWLPTKCQKVAKMQTLAEGAPNLFHFPRKNMLYLWITSTFLYLHFRHYRWQPHPEWFTMSAATQSLKAIRVQEMEPEQRNMTLQFLYHPNKMTAYSLIRLYCSTWFHS